MSNISKIAHLEYGWETQYFFQKSSTTKILEELIIIFIQIWVTVFAHAARKSHKNNSQRLVIPERIIRIPRSQSSKTVQWRQSASIEIWIIEAISIPEKTRWFLFFKTWTIDWPCWSDSIWPRRANYSGSTRKSRGWDCEPYDMHN